jgi:hypothetical protein
VEWLQRLRARAISHRRAKALLLEFLTDDQCRDYRRRGLFVIRSQSGHYYQLGRGDIIMRVEPGTRGAWRASVRYCFVQATSHDKIPNPDLILATALWLSCNEENFLRTAVATVFRPPFDLDTYVRLRWFS